MAPFQKELQRLLDEAAHSLDLAVKGNLDDETIQGLAGRCNGIRDAMKLYEQTEHAEIKKAYSWIKRVGHSRECDCNDDANAKCSCQGDEIIDNDPTKEI